MNRALKSSKSERTQESVILFKNLTNRMCFDAKNFGFNLVPSHHSFDKFGSLSVKKQEEILDAFKTFHQILSANCSKRVDLRDSRSTVWWAIRELNLLPPSELFDLLEEDDFFEIYDPDGIQIFRSFNFFELTSYSIEDIFSYSWPELYARSEFITSEMIEKTAEIFKRKIEGIVKTNYPLHVVVDKFSPGREWSVIRHKLFAPLKSKGQEIYLFNAFKVVDRKKLNHN